MILGVSFDAPSDNRAFRAAERFPYRLLSDEDRAVGAAYGVLRGPDERYPDVPRRISYLIDPTGMIAAAYDVTDVATHPDQVLADLERLARDG